MLCRDKIEKKVIVVIWHHLEIKPLKKVVKKDYSSKSSVEIMISKKSVS